MRPAVDPYAPSLLELGYVEKNNFGGVAFPAQFGKAKPIENEAIGAGLRAHVAIDNGKARSSVDAQIAGVLCLSVAWNRNVHPAGFHAGTIDTHQ